MRRRLLKVIVGLLLVALLIPMTIIHIIVWVITGRGIINEIVEWLCENEK
jgi:hypothetical protein